LESNIAASVSSILSQTQLALSQFIGSTDTDVEHLSGLEALSGTIQARDGEAAKKIYMGAVSPWFFTHYGPDSFNKNVRRTEFDLTAYH
jgi:glucan endo-1,3-alpha-glucosidase